MSTSESSAQSDERVELDEVRLREEWFQLFRRSFHHPNDAKREPSEGVRSGTLYYLPIAAASDPIVKLPYWYDMDSITTFEPALLTAREREFVSQAVDKQWPKSLADFELPSPSLFQRIMLEARGKDYPKAISQKDQAASEIWATWCQEKRSDQAKIDQVPLMTLL